MWDTGDKVTPLHVTGMREIAELLVNNGGNINAGLTKDGGSVLHSAVRANNVDMVKFLLDQKVETVPKAFFETALHTASEHDHSEIVALLLERNPSSIDALKDRERRLTALHIAAEGGYTSTCRILLEEGADISIRTSQDMTAVHLAARNLNGVVLRMLLEEAAHRNTGLINAVDCDGRTALYVCAASKGNGATECMESLIEYGAETDIQNKGGYTALHMAAIDKKPSRVNILIRNDADLSVKNQAGYSALHFINKKVPQCMKTFEERLDSGLKLEGGGNTECSAKIKMDFHKLSPEINSLQRQDIDIFMELHRTSHSSLLKHPLSQAFLYLKWSQIKYLHLFFVIFCHLVYSSVYSIYALVIYGSLCQTGSEFTSVSCSLESDPVSAWTARISWILLICFTLIYVLNECVKLCTAPGRYLKVWDSYLDLTLIASFPLISFHSSPWNSSVQLQAWQFHAAAIGCFITWLQMMFLIGKLPRFGKYVQMFRAVTLGVLNFMIAWISLIMAFAVSFMILFPNNGSFNLLPSAIIKVVEIIMLVYNFKHIFLVVCDDAW